MERTVKRSDVDWLKRALVAGSWRKARTMEMPHRTIRAVCEAYPETFLSGQKGYKLTQYANDKEMERAINDLRSRASHITARAEGIERALHSRRHVGQEELFTGGLGDPA